MAPLPPLRDGGCALPICPFGRACLPLISDAPDCKCSPGRLRFWVVWASCPACASSNFNPRTPCGARPAIVISMRDGDRFQSTRPVWGATSEDIKNTLKGNISIHAPVWGATDDMATRYNTVAISIHAPRGGRGGVSAGRPAGRSLCRTGSSCAYRVRSDCRSGTSRRERTGCRCFWKCPNRRT